MQAKKSYGQHFLTNELYAQRIADSLLLPHTQVLEVGPGKGMLTKYLLEKPWQLQVVEADPDMVAHLTQHFPALQGRIIADDFLRVKLDKYFQGEFAIVGNYPYNISSQILLKTVEYRHQVPEMSGMFQKEVADRVAAGPGSKTYGIIGILVQAFYEVDYLFSVGPGNFNPPPKVQSGVIRLRRRAQPLVTDELWPSFRTVVKQTFNQRRKMLRNTLKGLLPDTVLLQEQFTKRPEQLSVPEFADIAGEVAQYFARK